MMVSGKNDPFDSFLNSIQVVKDAFSPLESNFRMVAKNFKHCFNGVSKCGNLNEMLDGGKGKVSIKKFGGIFNGKGRNIISCEGVEKLNVNCSRKCLREIKDDRSYESFLHFEVALSFLTNGFVQILPGQFKSEKTLCNDSNVKIEVKSRAVGEINQEEFKVKEWKDFPFEFLIQENEGENSEYEPSTSPVNQFGQFRALTSLLEGNRADVNGFLGNLKFARVRGVPLGTVGVIYVKRDEEEIANAANQEDESEHLPPVEIITAKNVLKSALAGGISCAFSTALMHPIDTVKTQVQASTSLSFAEILSMLPQIGIRGVYKGSTPAILGQFTSHGLRTGIFEVSKLVLKNVAPTVPQLQVQSMASFFSTVVGTVWRIPCEVLKQRLQAGVFDNLGEAIVGTWQQDGLGGFFRGTGATLCREIPFYVAGAGLYAQSKKVVQKVLRRELQPWEITVVGAISGGLIGISTTPFDVIKTRMMISPEGHAVTASMIALSILQSEGPLGLFRGALPRFFWIAPLGAINFAGYELLRKAMENL